MSECACGAKLPKRRKVCDECKREKRRISQIAWYSRNRARLMRERKAKNTVSNGRN
jgi:hypothetical protein